MLFATFLGLSGGSFLVLHSLNSILKILIFLHANDISNRKYVVLLYENSFLKRETVCGY